MNLLQNFAYFSQQWLRDFTGRKWLVQQVHKFLDDPQAPRFLFIVGEPGIGKSTFAAHLWQQVQVPDAVHFCIGGRGSTTEPLRFIRSIAEQLSERLSGFGQVLIETQKVFAGCSVNIDIKQKVGAVQGGVVAGVSIQHLEIQGLSPETAFDRVIRLPLQALDEDGKLLQVVILVDALDEAVTHISHPNIVEILAQAQDLPTQVRFVLTSRPDLNVKNSLADKPHVIIDAQSLENQEDVTHYLTHILQQDEELQKALAGAGWDEARFVSDLGETSEWNFLYLNLVLLEIAAGTLQLGEDTLPHGLDGYYQYLLNTRLGLKKWNEWGANLMEVVLALQEPATLEQIAGYLGWSKRQTLQRLGQVSQLLDPTLQEQKRYWRHHWSVINFLADQEQAGDFWCEKQQGHACIAERYLAAWGGLEASQLGLQDPEKRDLDGGYGLRYLVEHLVQAKRLSDALSIIRPAFRKAKLVRFASDFWFVRDLEVIIGYLEERGQIDGLPAAIRCSLIHSLFASLVVQIPPKVLSALVQFGEGERAVQLAALSPTGEEKAAQFLAIAEALRRSGAAQEMIRSVLQDALCITRSLTRVAEGTQDLLRTEIAKQAAHLDWDWCRQILEAIEHPYIQAQSRMAVAVEVARDRAKATDLLNKVLPSIASNSSLAWDVADALGEIAQYHLEAVQSLVDLIESCDLRDLVRREVAKQLLERGSGHSALRIAEGITDSAELLAVLGLIAGRLAEENPQEACRILDEIPPTPEGARALLDFIRALSPGCAEYALKASSRIADANTKCCAFAQTALLYARARDIAQAQVILQSALDMNRQSPPSDTSQLFLSMLIGEIAAEIAPLDEKAAVEMVAEWESPRHGQYIASQVCQALLECDIELALRLAELIAHPYLKGALLAQAIFHLSPNDPRIPILQERIGNLVKIVTDKEHKYRLQTYLLASEGIDTPERLLSAWEGESAADVGETGLSKIIVSPSGISYPTSKDTQQRDDVLTDLALKVARRDVDQALIVLRAVLDQDRRLRGLVQLAHILSKQLGMIDPDGEDQTCRFRHNGSLPDDISVVVAQLAQCDIESASKIVEVIPDTSERVKAYTAMALALKDINLEQGQMLLERALVISQMRPESALRAVAYLELDKCISEEIQRVDFVKKAFSSLPVAGIPAAVPEITGHIAMHLATKGKEEIALRTTEKMPTTHMILDVPHKMRALLGIAEQAVGRQKLSIGKKALDEALALLQSSYYEAPSLPRLASLTRHYDPALAEQLFDAAVEIAMRQEMCGLPRFQILGGVAHFRASFDVQAALDAAKKISDPYRKADALMSAVTQGDMTVNEKAAIIVEAQELLAESSGDAIVKGRALLKIIDTGVPEHLELCDLLWDVVQTTKLAQPVDWFRRVGLLTKVYYLFKKWGDQKAAEEVVLEALDVARNDPFDRSMNMAQAAHLFLDTDCSRAVAILYEILQQARLEGYDAVWTAIAAIIPVMYKAGGSILVQQVHKELDIAEEFFA